MASTSELRGLLELLKEFGVVEYSDGTTSLKLGGSISVHNHKSGPNEPREERKIDPALLQTMRRLPAAYQAAFTLGED